MSHEEFKASDTWLAEILAPHAGEVQERKLIVRTEFDPRFQMKYDAKLEAALKRLLRFVFATLPEGCEAYLAAARSAAAVSVLGSGELTCRWQVAGRPEGSRDREAIAIRPVAGGGAFHRQSKAALELERVFAEAAWSLRLEATNDDLELWARAAAL